ERAPDLGGVYNEFGVGFNQNSMMNFTNEKSVAAEKAPAEVFRYDYKAKHLPIQIRHAQFRGENGSTRLEVYHSVLGSSLGSSQSEENEFVSSVNSVVGLFDPFYNEVDRQKEQTKLVGASKEQISDIVSFDETIFSILPEDRYRVVVKVENPEGNLLGISNFEVGMKRFDPDSLQLSDLELASKVETAQKKGRFYKHGLYVLPYTFSKLPRDIPATIYYEIYNLKKDMAGGTKYTVDYKVTAFRREAKGLNKLFRSIGKLFGGGKEQSVTASYERQGSSSDEKEYISLDIQKMPPGLVELSVTITDHLSNQAQTSVLSLEII
ncbi:MAG: hypothetical protein V3U73_04950, partial [bacterium]